MTRDGPFRSALFRLKHETLQLHAEAERHVRILDDDATDATYARFLSRMLGFHGPMEEAFALHPELGAAGFDAPSRRKQGLLRTDLSFLGIEAASLPVCPCLPNMGSLTSAIGAAYVLEGSTLGGAYIMARMRPRLGHLVGPATRFLEGYRDATGLMWRRFAAVVESVLVDSERGDAAVATAQATFTQLIAWLDEPGADPPHPFRRPAILSPRPLQGAS